ncbi:MAG TPA: hypothetical protein VI874_02275 [Candidatus Norongarragalinales archaeon]|nr:hypothetical protein [Candidatus Norongarragalinales archaeon]
MDGPEGIKRNLEKKGTGTPGYTQNGKLFYAIPKRSAVNKASMLNSKVAKWLNGEAMKTTILLEEAVYRRVVEEAVKKYGNTRSISTIVNEILKQALLKSKSKKPTRWSDLWGTLKTDIPTQKLKDLAREGWGP